MEVIGLTRARFNDPFSTFGSTGLGTNGFEVSLNYITGVPDTNLLGDLNLKIIFKSFLKRDDTTKEKLLLDFIKILSDESQIDRISDDLVIMSWVQIYPKLSIDISKNVRINAHQVQSLFVKILGKKYAKFLKDTAPVWLAGTFDTERLVSRSVSTSLLSAFRTEDKVDILWKLFSEQTLNFCYQVLKFETRDTLSDERSVGKDEAEAKYLRTVSCATNIITKIISSPEIELDLEQVLSLTELWDLFTTKDLHLKKSLLLLVIKLVESHSELVDDKLLKTISKAVIKSLNYKSATNNIIYSLIALPTLACIDKLDTFNSLFWDLGGKKTKEKFISFIALGSCSSSELYYDLLARILLKVPDSIVDYKSEADYERISTILAKDFDHEKLIPFRNKACSCFLNVQLKFLEFQSEKLVSFLQPFILQTLEKRLTKDIIHSFVTFFQVFADHNLLASVVDHIIKGLPDKLDNALVVENCFDILNLLKSDQLELLITKCFESLSEDSEKFPNTSFIVFNKIITSNVTNYKSQIESLISNELVLLAEEDSVDQVSKLLINYNINKDFLDAEILNLSFNSLFNKFLMFGETTAQTFLKNLPKLTKVDIKRCPDVQAFILNSSENYDYAGKSKESLIFNFLTKEVFINLFNSSVENGTEDVFVSEFLSKFDLGILAEVLSSQDLVVKSLVNYLFTTIGNPNSAKLLQIIQKDHNEIYAESLLAYVSQYPFVELDPIVTFAKNFEIPNIKISSDDLIKRIESAVGDNVDLRLAIANPLEVNVLLVHGETFNSSLNAEKILELVLLSRFIVKASTDLEGGIISCLALIGELALDYCFLHENSDDEILNYHESSMKLLSNVFQEQSLSQVVDLFFNEKSEDTVSQFMVQYINDVSPLSYYMNRVLKSVLSNYFESESVQTFEKLEINFNKLIKTPLKLATFILSSQKFMTSSKFERIRNVIASELIGLKTDQILSQGLTKLSLLNTLLLSDSSVFGIESFVPIPEQRLNMILRDITNWLDSEIAYDNEFIMIRIQLISLVNNYVTLANYSNSLDTTKFLDIGLTLLRDSIGIIILEQANDEINELITPLRYFSLKLFSVLDKNKDSIEAWSEDIDGIYEELIESLLSQPQDFELNQPLNMINGLYFKILSTQIPLKLLKQEDFFKLLDSKGDLQRLGVSILSKLILASQQDNIIEYELKRSKLTAESSQEDADILTIPHALIENISEVPEEYLEFEDHTKMYKFLWSWLLIFDHFKEVTQRMRADYIRQLSGNIESLLKFIFDQVDLSTDLAFIKRSSDSDEISSYALSDDYHETVIASQKHLIIHLYYLCCEHAGSQVQSWFNGIRDLQKKNLIEKFTTTYISSLIIDNEMNKAAKLIDANTINDDNLTLKVNRVAHEIKSMYLIDEKTMEMVIRIPSSYPLQNIIVDGPVRLGVKESQWKSWLMASQRVIMSQNFTIIGAIELFNKNVSLHFSGFEECAICYSILHYQDNSLPSKTCTTCNNKFHAACLYKWFKSSGGSTCPLCRSTFNFRK